MNRKLEKHICSGGCGNIAMMNPRKRNWCRCNPAAPFRMTPKVLIEIAKSVTARRA